MKTKMNMGPHKLYFTSQSDESISICSIDILIKHNIKYTTERRVDNYQLLCDVGEQIVTLFYLWSKSSMKNIMTWGEFLDKSLTEK